MVQERCFLWIGGNGCSCGLLAAYLLKIEMVQNIIDMQKGNGSLLNQGIAAGAARMQDAAGNGKDIAPLFGGKLGSDECATAFACLDDDDAPAQPADDAVAGRKVVGIGRACLVDIH